MPVVLIPAVKALRSRKRGGSVACTKKGKRSGAVRSQPLFRASHVWLGYVSRRRVPVGSKDVPVSHDGLRGTSVCADDVTARSPQPSNRRTSNEGANGVESQPNHDASQHSVNMGSPTLVKSGQRLPTWRRSSHSTQGWPVMGSAIGIQSSRWSANKVTAMIPNPQMLGGRRTDLYSTSVLERRIASAIR